MEAIRLDYRRAEIDDSDRAMLDFAVKLTRTPGAIDEADLDRLRSQGFDDRGIHDIVQVAALFAYYNRLADGMGVKHEPSTG